MTFAGDVVAAAISPDGLSVAYGVGEAGAEIRVLVRDLAGGQTQAIWTGESLMTLAWVSDGSHVLVSGEQQNSGTWIVPRLGGTPRLVADGSAKVAASPDGKTFALTNTGTMGFFVMSTENTTRRHVKMAGFRWSMGIDWHAGTDRVLLLTFSDDYVWSVWSVAPDGQEPTRLLSSNEPIRAMCSSPVSDVVYALRERGGSSELVRIPIGTGADSADVLLTGLPVTTVTENPYISQCALSADSRRLSYIRALGYANLWRLDLTRATGPTNLTQGTEQFTFPKVSPDGEWIVATRGPESSPELVKIRIGGGGLVPLGEGTGPAWSPNGQRLAFVSRRSGSPLVWIVRADGVGPEEVKDSTVTNERVTWLPDGRLAWQVPGARNYRIRDLSTGHDEYLVKDDSVGWIIDPKFSPRGDQVAVWWNRKTKQPFEPGMWLLSWPGREERRLTAERMSPIGWSADSQWIYTIPHAGRAVLRVSARSGKTERIGQFLVGLLDWENGACDLTPDRAAIICAVKERKSDAWIMEDFEREVR